MPYHVVCHDCTREGIVEAESIAKAQVRKHNRATGHAVEYAEVADGAGPAADDFEYGATDDD